MSGAVPGCRARHRIVAACVALDAGVFEKLDQYAIDALWLLFGKRMTGVLDEMNAE